MWFNEKFKSSTLKNGFEFLDLNIPKRAKNGRIADTPVFFLHRYGSYPYQSSS